MKRTITVKTQVEVDLDDFSLDALVAEIESRQDAEASFQKLRLKQRQELIHEEAREAADATVEEWKRIPGLHSGDHHPLHSIYYALKFGKPEHAIDLMRDYINDEFGVAL